MNQLEQVAYVPQRRLTGATVDVVLMGRVRKAGWFRRRVSRQPPLHWRRWDERLP